MPPGGAVTLTATVQLPSLPGASVEWGLPYCYVTLPPDALRRFRVGDRLFLWFAFGSFEVRPATAPRGGLTGLAAALDSFGLDSSGDDDADLRALASALDLPPGSGLDRVITACWRKREWDALAALEALEVLGPSGRPGSSCCRACRGAVVSRRAATARRRSRPQCR